jgi:hypothetical protein
MDVRQLAVLMEGHKIKERIGVVLIQHYRPQEA